MSCKVSTVNRGDVFRFQRTKVMGIVPIVEMTAESLKPVHCCEGRIYFFNGVNQTDPAEIIRGNRGQKVQSEICGRSPVSHRRLRFFLEVVRRQRMILCGDKCFKKPPGMTCDQS